MALVEVARGGVLDLARWSELEQGFGEGERGALRLDFRVPPPGDLVDQLVREVARSGVQLWDDIRAEGNSVWVYFTKALPPLVILAVIIGALTGLLVLLLGWILFKGVSDVGIPLLLLGALALGGLLLIRRST